MSVICDRRSKLLHAGHVHRLHNVFPGRDLVKNVIGQHLVVLDNATDLDLSHSECHVQEFRLLVPDQTLDFELEDALGKGVQFSVVHHLVHLYLENNDGFGDGFGLWCLLGGFRGLLFRFLLGFFLLLGCGILLIVAEEVITVLLLGSGCGGRGRGMSVSPGLECGCGEGAQEKIPVVCVWEGIDIGQF